MTFLHQSKNIRELRTGPPKCWKTGSVVETYPTPMLVLEFDQSGLSVVVKRPVTLLKPQDLKATLTLSSDKLPLVSEVAYYMVTKPQITDDWKPQNNQETFKQIMFNINALTSVPTLPYKTIVLDGVSRMQEFMMQYMPQTPGGSEQLADARKWAFSVGAKCLQVISTVLSLPCHVIILCHVDAAEVNPVTQKAVVLPLIYGTRPKHEIGGIPDNFFYQKMSNGRPRLITNDIGATSDLIKGLGARWPRNLPVELEPTFQAIYETEYPEKKV